MTLPPDTAALVERHDDLAKQLFWADVMLADNTENIRAEWRDGWWDTSASMPLSGPGFLRKWRTLAAAAAATIEAQARRIEESEGMVIVNDYQRAAFEIFRTRLEGRKIQVGFMPAAQCLSNTGEAVSGFTLFPDDGGEPEIWISDDTPVLGVPDVLFHELAHVLAGIDADHGVAFQAVEESLWADMDRFCADRANGARDEGEGDRG